MLPAVESLAPLLRLPPLVAVDDPAALAQEVVHPLAQVPSVVRLAGQAVSVAA